MKNYRIFESLRESVISKIFHYMKRKEFKRETIVYREGDPLNDGVYFIKEGEFQVTKATNTEEVGLVNEAGLPTNAEEKLRKSPIRSRKIKDMLRSRTSAKIQ